jgi:TonB-dependent receptor
MGSIRRLLIVVVAVLGYAICQGQKPGKLAGKIRDAGNNEPLSGVSIAAKDTKFGTASITDGSYILTLPAGAYVIRYSSTNYKIKDITEVVIKGNETTYLDILMEAAKKQLQEVVVTGTARKESQASVYSIQKRSSAASDGISIEAINRTPDNNAGQILKRVTGINMVDNKFIVVRGLGEQYNQTMLNGVPMTSTESNKNAFAFDLIPAAAIDNIVVNKTATPDMPGNFGGGVVQINTKDFPAKTFFSIGLQVGLSDLTYGKPFYSDERSKTQQLSFDRGIRALPKDFPSNADRVPFIYLNTQEQNRLLSKLPNNLVPVNQGKSGLNQQVQLGYGKNIVFKDKSQLGIVLSFNQRKTELIEQEVNMRNPIIGEEFFKNADLMGYYTKGSEKMQSGTHVVSDYSKNTRYKYVAEIGGVANFAYRFGTNKLTFKNLFTQVYSNQFIYRPEIFEANYTWPITDDIRNYIETGYNYISSTKRLINSVLAGEHRAGKNNETRIDWNVSSTANTSKLPDSRSFIFGTDSTRQLVGTYDAVTNISDLLKQSSRTWTNLKDIIYSGGINITTPFILFKQKQLFKAGFYFQNRTRENRASIIPYNSVNGSLSSVLSIEDILNRKTLISLAAGSFAERGGDYNAGSSSLAIYESIENKIGEKWRAIWGLRIEKYQQNSNIFKSVYFPGFEQGEPVVINLASRTNFNFLPSLNVIYSPIPAINIRAAYSSTVIRPDLKDIVPIPTFDLVNFRLTSGNAELRNTSLRNLDLKMEWFPSSGEILSFALFYKKLTDPIEYVVPDPSKINLEGLSGVPVNTGKAFVQGIEFEVRKKIDFIKIMPWLKNLTVFGNATLLKSKVSAQKAQSLVVDNILEHTLTGQPPYIVNTGINIAAFKSTLELTVSYNKSGDYLGELGSFDNIRPPYLAGFPGIITLRPTIPNYFIRTRDLMDLVLTKTFLSNKLKLKFNVTNIFREPYILYQDLNNNRKFDAPLQILGGPTKYNGVQIPNVAGNYKGGVDNTGIKIIGQRSYSFSVSYTF